MSIRLPGIKLTAVLILFSVSSVQSQTGLCPPNLDLEFGDFTNWECKRDSVMTSNGTVYWSSVIGPVFNRHTIISSPGGVDPYGFFPTISPNGSNYSVKLGNTNSPPGKQATAMSYTYTIPSNVPQFSMLIWYAVVLFDPPSGHSEFQKPRFKARIIDLSTSNPIPCVDFDFLSSATPAGFLPSPLNSNVLYKDWTPVSIDLTAFIGRTIKLEFVTLDCTLGGHFGYAYVDVNPNCNGAITGSTICQGDTTITLIAPFGFQSYEWYQDNTFATLLATTQNLVLNPAPSVGTVIPVVVNPYLGFGCRDTLYATITVSPKPVSRAGPDATVCKYGNVQIGGPSTVGHIYEWTPASQVSSPTVSNPYAWNIPPNPTQFIVKTTDILTGCYSYDTTIVTNASVDTAIRKTGASGFCPGGTPPVLSVNPAITSIQWYNGATPILGATSATYQPNSTGSYWAQVSQGGCTDTTASITINVDPLPVASFVSARDTGCITNNSFRLTNTSTVSDNGPLTFNWKFSDGVTLQTADVVKSFTSIGSYNVEMTAITSFGCRDTAYGLLYVLPNGTANFSFDSICSNRPVLFRNLSNENGSASVNYTWNFNNGGPPSGLRDPLPVTFTTGGPSTVTLQMTALGCESSPVSVTKPIQVNNSLAGMRYRDITVPQGSSTFINVRDIPGGNYSWRPRIQLSSYNARYAEFYATGDDTYYYIDITDKHSCVTTDTMLVQVLKKPGFYLPTGFTPNGDGLNDIVKPYLIGMKSLKSFSIYNRSGSRIFYTGTYGEGWNGKYKGVEQIPGVYVWVVQYYDNDNKLVTEKGSIALIK